MAGAGWMLESVILEQRVCPVHLSFLGQIFLSLPPCGVGGKDRNPHSGWESTVSTNEELSSAGSVISEVDGSWLLS